MKPSWATVLPRRTTWPTRKTLGIHISRGVVVMVMAALFFWGIARVPLAHQSGDAAAIPPREVWRFGRAVSPGSADTGRSSA